MATKETKDYQTSTTEDRDDRKGSARDRGRRDESPCLSEQATAAIASFTKTAAELAVLSAK
jgi:hypothetical protein